MLSCHQGGKKSLTGKTITNVFFQRNLIYKSQFKNAK